ncbi:FtsQ-type POTRA domain-containing protein [Nocardioides seonyuensis]|uniref:FtsQ-type POTRA domain-containing protein n=1 Tax=Nocardioides seonyuensis TaxID=2518371 RepID=A0A4P7IAJ1_9ACTN|nr:FtsQ-type POTRA domain-containing protein [Nocardioides seonyuensis]QBX54028.1 FtsQ-type POTRA domain-containing protein [Nocardioides seonyuensis]QBX57352.1 FtsQ-type POTRA domain-containing protein [Nocardioides seonyuensis]
MTATEDRATDDRATERTRRRFARRQWARRWVSLRYAVALVLVLVLAGTAVWLLLFSSVLSVTKVEVSGVDYLSEQDVRRVADVTVGEQLALVDLDRSRRRVGSMAEVKDVEVTRAWPDTVQVAVTERTAIAVVELGGRIRGLDPDGVVFRDYPKVPPGMPRVRALSSTGTDALKEAATVVSALPAELAPKVDHVQVETVDQITLVLRDGREVLWGSAEESQQKAQVVAVLLGEKGRIFDVSVPGSPTAR